MKAWAIPVVVIFAALTFVCSVFLMPAAELLPAQITSGSWMPGLSPIRSYGTMQFFQGIGKSMTDLAFGSTNLQELVNPEKGKPLHDDISPTVRAYILYAVCLAAAMISAAIANNAIGRWDSEEKTIVPVKK